MAPLNTRSSRPASRTSIDVLAVAIALTLAALIRFNIIHQITW